MHVRHIYGGRGQGDTCADDDKRKVTNNYVSTKHYRRLCVSDRKNTTVWYMIKIRHSNCVVADDERCVSQIAPTSDTLTSG